jgi:hypothetical protein
MNSREKTLLKVMIGILLLVGALAGGMQYKNHVDLLISKRDELASKRFMYESSENLKQVLSSEMKWIEQFEPDEIEYVTATNQFEEFLTSSSRNYGFADLVPIPVSNNGEGNHYKLISFKLRATATQTQILQWLSDLHKPSQFRAITNLQLKQTEDSQIQCEVTVERRVVTPVE